MYFESYTNTKLIDKPRNYVKKQIRKFGFCD